MVSFLLDVKMSIQIAVTMEIGFTIIQIIKNFLQKQFIWLRYLQNRASEVHVDMIIIL